MRVLFDTNIVLDFLLDRRPFADDAAYLFSKVERSEITGFICATTVTTIFYLSQKVLGKEKAVRCLGKILSLFEIAPVNRIVLNDALSSRFHDYEDAVIHEAALHLDIEYIITRDTAGYKRCRIPIYTPAEFISLMATIEKE